MSFWKELRTRWMYWRYRNITRARQRLQLKWSARKNRHPVYMAPSGRGIRPVRTNVMGGSRAGRAWILLIAVSVGMATLQYEFADQAGSDIVLLGDIAILAVGYLIWLKAP
jgi:hypothetical protein